MSYDFNTVYPLPKQKVDPARMRILFDNDSEGQPLQPTIGINVPTLQPSRLNGLNAERGELIFLIRWSSL